MKQATTNIRDRDATKKLLMASVVSIAERDGLQALGVNSIAREAGVDKVLIYRYFDGLDGLFEAVCAEADLWWKVDEIVDQMDFSDPASALASYIVAHRKALLKRPLTLRILAAEMTDRSALTIALEKVREIRGNQMRDKFAEGFRELGSKASDVFALAIMLSAATQYLTVRSRDIAGFGGMQIQEDRTWDDIAGAVKKSVQGLLRS